MNVEKFHNVFIFLKNKNIPSKEKEVFFFQEYLFFLLSLTDLVIIAKQTNMLNNSLLQNYFHEQIWNLLINSEFKKNVLKIINNKEKWNYFQKRSQEFYTFLDLTDKVDFDLNEFKFWIEQELKNLG